MHPIHDIPRLPCALQGQVIRREHLRPLLMRLLELGVPSWVISNALNAEGQDFESVRRASNPMSELKGVDK